MKRLTSFDALAAATVGVGLVVLAVVGMLYADDSAETRRFVQKGGDLQKQVAELTKRVEKLESQLKNAAKPAEDTRQVKIFPLLHGDAKSLASIVDQLFGGRGYGELRIAFDARTNSIIATGQEANLMVIEAVLLKLDEPVAKKKN